MDILSKNIVEEDKKNNKIYLHKINSSNINNVSTTKETNIYIDDTVSSSGNLFFFKGIKDTYSTINLAGSGIVTYTNKLSDSSSSTISSIYEHIRGYVYRSPDWPSYISSSRSAFIISNSTTGYPCLPSLCGALTGIRTIFFNKKLINDFIKPNTVKISVTPVNVSINYRGLNFNNSNINSSSSGQYASVTGQQGLSGSLSSGISGKAVTGFTIGIRFKPINSGSENQTLLHRRIGDKSLTSLNYVLGSGNGINSNIITEKYIDLNPLSAITNITSKTLIFTYEVWTVSPEPLTSVIINLTNKGGGQLNWSVSAQNPDSVSWLSLSSALTTGIIHSSSNMNSATASITANISKSITGLTLNESHISNIVIYNSSTSELCYNLPIIIPINITTNSNIV